MSKKPMSLGWIANFLAGLSVVTAMGAGSYMYGRYQVQDQFQRTQSARQPTQAQASRDGTPTSQSGTSNHVQNTTGEERNATWSSTGDTIFAFGDQGRYLLAYRNEPHGTNWQLKTMGLKYGLINAGVKDRITRPYFYAWTSTDDELLGYMDGTTKKPLFQFYMDPNRPTSAPTYTSLLTWLAANVNTKEEMQQTKVVFGAKSTYFASNGKKCTFHDLPSTLHNFMMEKRYSLADPEGDSKSWIPRIVALGLDNTYVAVWHDGDKLANLSNDPSIAPLATELSKPNKDDPEKARPAHQYENIVLSPFSASNYFRVKKTGHIAWSFAASNETLLDLTIHVGIYSQVRAKEDGTIYNLSFTSQGVERDIDFGPETDHSEADIRAALASDTDTVKKVPLAIVERIKAIFW